MTSRLKIELDNSRVCDLSNIDTSKTKIRKVKELVQDKEGIAPDTYTLIFGGATLNDDKLLSDYDIGGSRLATTITAVFRRRGGSANDKYRNPDITHPKIKFKQGSDCLGMGEDDEPTIEITTCGCIYAPSSLHSWADDELRGKLQFKQFECPNCKSKNKCVPLSFDIIACACGWTQNEYDNYYKLFKRKQLNPKEYKSCPFCYALVHRPENDTDTSNRSRCSNPKCISAQDWCWKCSEPWKTDGMVICGNPNCKKSLAEKNLSLKSCQLKRFQWGEIDCQVPMYRA